MKRGIVAFILCFVIVFSLTSVDAKWFNKNSDKEKCDISFIDSGMDEALGVVNSNPKYLEFINQSKYDAVKLIMDKTVYYFVYENGEVKQVESAEEDFSIKVNCNHINKIINAYNSQDPKLKKMILNRIPIMVKINLVGQCMDTEWCKNEVF
jgi:hypothetical protein